MSTRPIRRPSRSTVAVLTISVIVFLGITAAQATHAVNITLPSLPFTIGGFVTLLAGEFGRRLLKKLDGIGEKCDQTHEEFGQFRAEIRIVLQDIDGRGGLIQDVRDLQAEVFRDGGPAPRGVTPPPGFAIAPTRVAAKREAP